jgi:hypothetical protein
MFQLTLLGTFRNDTTLACCTNVSFWPGVDVWFIVTESYNKALHLADR